ncbi:MAG: hypothetical protein J1E80_02190 [Desulfovibrionaceae bacterium]|nr:hypothetical protein [Desulfovibrionaceae bacterium]
MKINEELERVLGTEAFRQQPRTVGGSGGDGFEDLLTRQLMQGEQKDNADLLRALGDPLRLANMDVMTLGGLNAAENPGDPDSALLESLTAGLAQGLDGLDSYAAGLGDPSSDGLRRAWSALESLDGTIAGMRQDLGKLSQPNAELESMLNELEVLAATEKFKFNRGDYLIG